MDRADRDPVSFSPPRVRLLLHAGGTAFFAALGLLATRADIAFWQAAGWLLLVLFGLATAVLVARAARPGPSVVVDASGITDRTTLAATGLVRWEEIAGVRKREIGRGTGREKLLEVILLQPERFRARPRSRFRQLADRYRELIKQPEVSIPGSMVAMQISAVVAAIQRHRPTLDVMELPPRQPGLRERLFRSKAHPPPRQFPQAPSW